MQCPVCGISFTPSPATPVVTLYGKDHPVCSSDCARKMRSNPPRYGVSSQEPKEQRKSRR